MGTLAHSLTLVVVAGTLLNGSSSPDARHTARLLALLDPSSNASRVCGGKDNAGSMRSKLMLSAVATQAGDTQAGSTQKLPLYEGLGSVHFPISTAQPMAQRYFSQGLKFAYGFNHQAAIASFREAQRLDPSCAMCFWGEALAHGPNINAPMDTAANARALEATARARSLSSSVTPLEQGLIAAMQRRYSPNPHADRATLDAAYADSMLALAAANPKHDNVALLAAEAAMDTRPWDYWQADRQTPQPRLGQAVQLVEAVLARSPDHPQAAHLYIHLMENGPDPKRAEAAADRLASPLSPSSGHLVHMPSHIYYRLGRWKDSMRVNAAAARADEAWIKASNDQGLVRYGYYPHNVHFLVASAQMAGDMRMVTREVARLQTILDPETSSRIAWIQAINAAPYFAASQFATPVDILAMKETDPRLPYAAAMRRYARALARANQRDRAGFDEELQHLRLLREQADFKPMEEQGVPAVDLLQLAESVARARWAYANRQFTEAARLYRDALEIENKIPYMEPPYWYYPVHQSLGAALYRDGNFGEARNAFMTALVRSPNNGWALYGLFRAESALGRKAHANAARAALQRAWSGDPEWLRMDRL
jgi:tetratricopeptide (TPR) repeat protein